MFILRKYLIAEIWWVGKEDVETTHAAESLWLEPGLFKDEVEGASMVARGVGFTLAGVGLLSILNLGVPRPSCLLTMPKYTLSSMMDQRTLSSRIPSLHACPLGEIQLHIYQPPSESLLYKAFDRSTFQTFPTKQPLPSSVLQGMLTDKHRHLRCSRCI